jgi:hypothetical protein
MRMHICFTLIEGAGFTLIEGLGEDGATDPAPEDETTDENNN